MSTRRVLILGGGYAGLAVLRRLARLLDPAKFRLVLLDASDSHTIKTRFHEVAVSSLRDVLVRFPLAALARASGAEFVRARASGVDFDRRIVDTDQGPFDYDRLVLALGGETNYFGVPGAAEHTVALQTREAAAECNRRLAGLSAGGRGAWAERVVVCGAGIEGLEVAAMLCRQAPEGRRSVTVVERSTRLMERSQCRESERAYLQDYFRRHSVELRLGCEIREVRAGEVAVDCGDPIPADLVYWCSGIRRVRLQGIDPSQPFLVNEFLHVPERPEVFAVGDFTTVATGREWANLASAQRALYQGELAAENIAALERGEALKLARYAPKGEVIALGDLDGVGVVRGFPVRGLAAAALKKGIEAHYLTELYGQVPKHLWDIARGGTG